MSRRALAISATAVVLLSSVVGPAAATSPTPASGTMFGQGQLVEFEWGAGVEPPTWLRSAINSAAQAAGQSALARTPIFAYRAGSNSSIKYTANIPTSYAIGYANRNAPHSFTIRLRPHGYVLDWGTLRWCQFYASPPNGCYDAEMITLHEFGHILTLDHADESEVTEWTDTVMHASPKTKAKAGWNAHDLGRCDIARLQLRYELHTSSSLVSTCLSLGTATTLATPASSVAHGTSVALSATLSISTAAGQGSLAGDPLSNRIVWLQRRAPGATSWTNLVQLDPQSGAGGYSKSLVVTATYDYRARFVSPSYEGLENSSSAVVRVKVIDPCVNSHDDNDTINAPTC